MLMKLTSDEEALVKGASHFGYTFFAKSQTTYFVRVRDGSDSTKDLHFEFKDIIEFDRLDSCSTPSFLN